MDIIKQAWQLAKFPIVIALLITPIRFGLELAGVPDYLVFPIGLLWWSIAVSAYWATKHFNHSSPYKLVFVSLLILAPISRIPVFVLWWITKTWNIGTHYDIFENWIQAFVGQFFWGPLIQMVPSMIVASIILMIKTKNTESVRSQ